MKTSWRGRLTLLVLAIQLYHTTDGKWLKDDYHSKTRSDDPFGQGRCKTEGCIKAAASILLNMDNTQDPCDDFYQFSCGGFINRVTIPQDKVIVDTIDRVQSELTDNLKAIIEEPKLFNDPEAIKKLKDMYLSCMDTTTIKRMGLPYLEELVRSFGGWPVVEGSNWMEQNFDWQKMIYKFRDKGVFYDFLISLGVAPDPRNTKKHIIHLDQPPFAVGRGASRQWEESEFSIWRQTVPRRRNDDPGMKMYFTFMVDMAVWLGANRSKAEPELQKVLLFETTLAEIASERENVRNLADGYNKLQVRQLYLLGANIDWLNYLNEIIPAHIRPSEEVLVLAPVYFHKLSRLLEITDKRILANFLVWQAVQSVVAYLGPPFQDYLFGLHRHATGQERRRPRWLECLGHANQNMGVALGALYVRKYFNNDAKEKVQDIVTTIHSEFGTLLRENDWMDYKTLKKAIAKHSAILYHVAYPDELTDARKLDHFYRRLRVNRRQHFRNSLRANKFRRAYHVGQLRKPVRKESWVYHAEVANVNALYGVLENSIQINAGMLHGWFFQHDRPQYLNFGSIGAVVGHEITHGFDDQGRQFDENGNLKSWWDPQTDAEFARKAFCFIKQYQNYTLPEINQRLDGLNTLGENLADNAGVKIAYLAYRKWAKRNEESYLPALDFSPNQLFWISYANNWCGKIRPEILHMYVTRGRHSPNAMRVNGPLANLQQFAKDFKCPSGSPMNPTRKCELW